jgi:hypothetical protein
MHLGEISFCDRIGFNIKSDEIKKQILQQLEAITGFKVIQKHYDKFEPGLASRLNSMPHMLSLRTNGNPYLLFLTTYNYENQCIFIDKKIQHGYCFPRMILSKLWFEPSLFKNTLLDGEMVRTATGDWHFIINDIICLNNQVLDKQNIIKRIAIVYDILQNKFKDDEFNCCHLLVKKYFVLDQLDNMVNTFMPSLPYTCRGIYFKPFYLKFRDILLNFDDSLVQKVVRFKYKHLDGHTFKENLNGCADQVEKPKTPDQQEEPHTAEHVPKAPPKDTTNTLYYVRKTSNTDVYELYTSLHEPKATGIALVNTIKTSKMLKELFRNLNITERVAMNCVYNPKFQKYIPESLA